MRNISCFCFFVVTVALSIASCKKEPNTNVKVVRDCTGTYLQVDGKDFQVCNLEKVAAFSDGTSAKASFKRIDVCNGSAKDAIVCMMYHPSEGWIKVESIK